MADVVDRGTAAARIASVQAQVTRLELDDVTITPKNGRAFSYKFLSESTMFEWLAEKLHDAGLATSPPRAHVTGRDGNLVEVEVEVDFINVDDPSDRETGTMVAQATDTGDKAAAKAITSAVRYLYWKTFRFPAEDPAADAERSNVPQETAADRRAAKLVGEARALAQKKGVTTAVETNFRDHLQETGLVVPHPDFTAALIAQMKGLPDALTPDAPAGGAEKPAEAPPADDPFGVLDGKEPVAPTTDPGLSEETAAKVTAVMNGLMEVRGDVDWMAKLVERCQEWYGRSDWQTLTDDQGKDLATKLEATRLELVKRVAAGQ